MAGRRRGGGAGRGSGRGARRRAGRAAAGLRGRGRAGAAEARRRGGDGRAQGSASHLAVREGVVLDLHPEEGAEREVADEDEADGHSMISAMSRCCPPRPRAACATTRRRGARWRRARRRRSARCPAGRPARRPRGAELRRGDGQRAATRAAEALSQAGLRRLLENREVARSREELQRAARSSGTRPRSHVLPNPRIDGRRSASKDSHKKPPGANGLASPGGAAQLKVSVKPLGRRRASLSAQTHKTPTLGKRTRPSPASASASTARASAPSS